MKRVLILLLILSDYGCVTYRKCEEKFGSVVTDTTFVEKQVTVNVPKDSVILSLKTDTTKVYKEIQQGRAKIIYSRTHERTIIRADCDTATVTKYIKVPVSTKHIVYGVNPWWKSGLYVLLCMFIGSWLAFAFRYFFVNYKVIQINDKLAQLTENQNGNTNKHGT